MLANEWATGIKTGATTRAGFLLASSGTRKGADLIGVVVGADSEAARDSETVELMDFGFSLYSKRTPLDREVAETSTPIRFRSDERLELAPARSVTVGVRRGQRLSVRLRVPGEVEGPIGKGEEIGTADVLVGGRRVARVDLVATTAVTAPTFSERAKGFLTGNLLVVIGAVSAIMIVALAFRRSRTRKARDKLRRLGRRQS